jgi:SAM-dependent methyltransferase
VKVILTKDVPKLGKSGEMKQVADGYATNFLIPQSLAVPAAGGTYRAWQHDIASREDKRVRERADAEIVATLLKSGTTNFMLECLDINQDMLERGRCLAQRENILQHMSFCNTDINSWRPKQKYQVVMAIQSLHHFVELEMLFDKVHQALHPEGYFLADDMIGRNGHMRWPEALELVHALWSLLDEKYKWNNQLRRQEAVYDNWDCSIWGGFEGVRAQDILPLLVRTFQFDSFIGFGNLINVFVDRGFGYNFDVSNPKDCAFIDFVAGLDDYFIESGKIKPTQMLAAMTKTGSSATKVYRHLTPEFCIRDPNL